MNRLLGLAGEDHTVVFGLEPLHGILLGQTVREANLANLNMITDKSMEEKETRFDEIGGEGFLMQFDNSMLTKKSNKTFVGLVFGTATAKEGRTAS